MKRSNVFLTGLCAAMLLSMGCVQDRDLAAVKGVCPNGTCDEAEDPYSCPDDCVPQACPNNLCDFGETAATCPQDCQGVACGDGECEASENAYVCPEDCPPQTCGNGICDPGEAEGACPADCFPGYCGNGICEYQETPKDCPEDCPKTTKADILFVVDNSQSMLNEQQSLHDAFPVLFQALHSAIGEVPDLHIGVVTTDLGTADYNNIRFCEVVGGDGGELGMVKGEDLAAACVDVGQRYIVDVEPQGCEIEKLNTGQCGNHTCGQEHCDAIQQTGEMLTLITDGNGCPRCRNFQGTLADTFACMASVGISGCGFEQPLEAMYRALDHNPANEGFLRSDAVLAVVLVSDEDDCSASRPDILYNPDPAENVIDSTLGYLHSFRCFEFGVECDHNFRDLGPRQNCKPRTDPQALLWSMDRYYDLLGSLKDPGQIVVAALAGPVTEPLTVQSDSQNRPELRPSCRDSTGQGATPAVRLHAFAQHYNGPEAMDGWAYTSVCHNTFDQPLEGLGFALRARLGYDAP